MKALPESYQKDFFVNGHEISRSKICHLIDTLVQAEGDDFDGPEPSFYEKLNRVGICEEDYFELCHDPDFQKFFFDHAYFKYVFTQIPMMLAQIANRIKKGTEGKGHLDFLMRLLTAYQPRLAEKKVEEHQHLHLQAMTEKQLESERAKILGRISSAMQLSPWMDRKDGD